MSQGTVLQINTEVTEVTVSNETVTLDISPEIVEVSVNNMAIPTTFVDAGNVGLSPYGTITATNVQDALAQLADQDFRQATTPTGSNLQEGDTWYNIETNQFYVYRRSSPTEFSWFPIMVGNGSSDTDTLDAGAF